MSIVDKVAPAQKSRSLWLSTVAFTTCFAVWTIFSIISLQIQKSHGFKRNRIRFAGWHADTLRFVNSINTGHMERPVRWSYRLIVMVTAAVATFLLTIVDTYIMYLVAALGIGVAGGSFAVGIAYTSRWFPGYGLGHFRTWQHQCCRPN